MATDISRSGYTVHALRVSAENARTVDDAVNALASAIACFRIPPPVIIAHSVWVRVNPLLVTHYP
jgi:hypothetical protein